MNKNNLIILIFSFLVAFLPSCKRETPIIFKKPGRPTELPPITTEGKNTFGWLVDGELLVPYPRKAIKDNFVKFYYGVKWADLEGTLQVGGTMEGETGYESRTVSLYLPNRVFNEGDYVLFTDSNTLTGPRLNEVTLYITDKSGNVTFSSWRVYNPDCGRIKVLRLDTFERIIAGTFYFDAVNKDGDTIKVTDGRFDLKY
ncbi:MAG: DUF6252 family protein [Bacteroidetes bacterium]|nr:DUF6252 family protein [Bacteroidota bacterium]